MEKVKLDNLIKLLDTNIDSRNCSSYIGDTFCVYDIDKFSITKDAVKNLKQKIIESTHELYGDIINSTIANNISKEIRAILDNELKKIQQISGRIEPNGKIEFLNKIPNLTDEELKEIKLTIANIHNKDKDENPREIGRSDKETFLSTIVDMLVEKKSENIQNNIQNTTIRFLTPDMIMNEDTCYEHSKMYYRQSEAYFEQLKAMVEKNKNKPNQSNILLVPYSANGHITTLIVDTNKFPEKGSCKIFDSGYSYDTKDFCNGLLNTFDNPIKINSQQEIREWLSNICGNIPDTEIPEIPKDLTELEIIEPINKKVIQKIEGECSFYTEAFLMLMDEKLQDPNKTITFGDIDSIVNNPDFIKELEEKKEKYFQDYYKERIEEYNLKQEYENKKREVEKEYEDKKSKLLKKKEELESLEQKKKEELESMEQSEKYKKFEEETEKSSEKFKIEFKKIMEIIEESQQIVQTQAQQTQDKESITQTQKPIQVQTPNITVQDQIPAKELESQQLSKTYENLTSALSDFDEKEKEKEQKQEQNKGETQGIIK